MNFGETRSVLVEDSGLRGSVEAALFRAMCRSASWRDQQHRQGTGTALAAVDVRTLPQCDRDFSCCACSFVWQASPITRFTSQSQKTLHVISDINADFLPGSMTLVRARTPYGGRGSRVCVVRSVGSLFSSAWLALPYRRYWERRALANPPF